MRRFAIAALAVFAFGLSFILSAGEATAQGGNLVGCYGRTSEGWHAITDNGSVYKSLDEGVTWSYQDSSAPPGLVDICWWVEDDLLKAFAISASGECSYAYFDAGFTWYLIGSVGAGTDFVNIDRLPNGDWVASTACGDVYRLLYGLLTWTYQGNVFGAGPSPTESESWSELKGEFRASTSDR
jgi:photosystem II stability/assembly factor-like uncharacterized protein